jgi:hypothetical protein
MTGDSNGRKHIFDDPKNVKRVLRGLYVACGLVFLADIANLVIVWMGGHELRHAERTWEGLPGFYSIYGFVACVILVLIAKEMRKVLMRDEDYYDR